jgi:hypothetical protein
MYLPATQNIEGGPIEAAANKTITSQAAQVEATKALGAGQKGSSRRRKRNTRRHRGGASSLNAVPPQIPTANSIPGVSSEQLHLNNVNNLNQIRADKSYDSLINAQPRQIAGKRRTKRRGKTNGRRSHRTYRRGHRKSSSRRRRSRRIL